MHYVRDLVHKRIIDLHFCPSSKKSADIFTKIFTEQKFHSPCDRLGVKDTITQRLFFLLLMQCTLRGGFSHEFFLLSSLYFSVHQLHCLWVPNMAFVAETHSSLPHSSVQGGCWRYYTHLGYCFLFSYVHQSLLRVSYFVGTSPTFQENILFS